MYFAKVMDQKAKMVDEARNGMPSMVQQPVQRRSDPSPLAHVLVVLIFVGLLLGIMALSASKNDASGTKARKAPPPLPMIHQDR